MTKKTISYDDIPYALYSFDYARPEALQTIGKLFGMSPPAIETARVLELACGSGINMLSFAETYPKSYSLGVDLSKAQIEHGTQMIKELGLKNIDLKHCSITDLDESFGKFDYIISHGVFSWVPDFVKDKILEISSKLLSPNGIAFVSYNTLPGWNMQKTMKDLMQYHAYNFQTNQDMLQQAKLALEFVNESLQESTGPYARFLKEETATLFQFDDAYIFHEYLGEESKGFYFYDFMDKAKHQKLNYLGDVNISSMFLGRLPAKAVEKLQTIPDIIRSEQYMDFITNRKFRTTLLVHENISLDRNINIEKLKEFYSTFNIRPATLEKEADLNDEITTIHFYYNNSAEPFISSANPILKAILYVYAENIGNPLTFNEIAKIAQTKLKKFAISDFLYMIENHIIKLIFHGCINISATKPNYRYNIQELPKASKLALYQAKHNSLNKNNMISITNQINSMIGIFEQEKYIIELLDGKHNIPQIKESLLNKFAAGILTAKNEQGEKVTDPKLLENFTDYLISATLEKLRINYLLV